MKNDTTAKKIIDLCEAVDSRALANDGPVGSFYTSVRPSECDALARLAYRLAKAHLYTKQRARRKKARIR